MGTSATPSLPNLNNFNPLAGLSQEKLQQLALLQLLGGQNPGLFGLGFGLQNQGPQVITTSTPVYKTETLYSTSTIPLFLGAKKFFTTLTQAVGVTTRTEYETTTQTVNNANGFGNFGQNLAQNPLQPSGGQIAAPKIGGGGGFIVTSDPVIQEKEVPSTVYK